jgi:peptidoglycan hydrolase-like protein with peptidoglycan-binding domain
VTPLPLPPPDPGWPALSRGNKGDEVVWLQQHLGVPVTSTFDATTEESVQALQTARGLPVTGETDAATWQAALSQPNTPKQW